MSATLRRGHRQTARTCVARPASRTPAAMNDSCSVNPAEDDVRTDPELSAEAHRCRPPPRPASGGRPGAAHRPQGPAAHDHAGARASEFHTHRGCLRHDDLIGRPRARWSATPPASSTSRCGRCSPTTSCRCRAARPSSTPRTPARSSRWPTSSRARGSSRPGVGSGALTMSLLRAVGDARPAALLRAARGLRRDRPRQRRGLLRRARTRPGALTVGDLVESLPIAEPAASTASSSTCSRPGSASTPSPRPSCPAASSSATSPRRPSCPGSPRRIRDARQLHRAGGLGVPRARLAPRGPRRPPAAPHDRPHRLPGHHAAARRRRGPPAAPAPARQGRRTGDDDRAGGTGGTRSSASAPSREEDARGPCRARPTSSQDGVASRRGRRRRCDGSESRRDDPTRAADQPADVRRHPLTRGQQVESHGAASSRDGGGESDDARIDAESCRAGASGGARAG